MKAGVLFSLILLLISTIVLILGIVSIFFYSIPWIESILSYILPLFYLIFHEYSLYVYGAALIGFVFLLAFYIIGYNISKSKHLGGSIMYIFSLVGFVFIIFVVTQYAYFGILFNRDLTLVTRMMLFFVLLPVSFAFNLVLTLVNVDFIIFLKDLRKARKMWKKERPKYEIEVKGNITYINIETDKHIFTPVPMLITAKYLQSQGFSVSWFVKGAFNHLFSLVITYLIGWPRARNVLFGLMGMKIGDNCHISSKAIPDPLLPELIEFEDGSGCGIGVRLLTHNAMNMRQATFSFGPIKVCENARIGAYSVILPGVTIGKGSIIGANSVVTDDIPPYSIAYGSPAKVTRKLTDDEKKEADKKY